MNIDEMQRAWWDRQARVRKWGEALFDSAYKLTAEVRKQLNPTPATFIDGHGNELQVVQTYAPDSDELFLRMSPEAVAHLNDLGELRFSIGVYLVRSPGSATMTLLRVQAGVRANNQRIEWCLWDPGQEAQGRAQSWAPNVEAIASFVIERLENWLQWNPMTGPDFKVGLALSDDQLLH